MPWSESQCGRRACVPFEHLKVLNLPNVHVVYELFLLFRMRDDLTVVNYERNKAVTGNCVPKTSKDSGLLRPLSSFTEGNWSVLI